MRRIGSIALILLALSAPASATTYGVKADGSSDYTSINTCMTTIVGFDVCEIRDSASYDETVNDASTFLTLSVLAGQTPVMDSNDTKANAIKYSSNWNVSGLTIREYTADGIEPRSGTPGTVTIAGNVIFDVSGYGIDCQSTTCTVERNITYDTTLYGILCGGGTIRNNLVRDSLSSGIFCIAAATCTHNTVDSAAGTYGLFCATSHFNIVTNGSTGIRADTAHTYNISFGNTTNFNGGALGTGDVVIDPAYTDGAGNDHTLSASSPAIGFALTSTQTIDLLSASRTGIRDAGAYERAQSLTRPVVAGATSVLISGGVPTMQIKAGAP